MLAVRLFRAEFTALADEKIVLSGSDSMLSFSASFTRTQTALVVEQPANMNSIIDFGFKQLPPKGLRATKNAPSFRVAKTWNRDAFPRVRRKFSSLIQNKF
jgi:hypothetical protein